MNTEFGWGVFIRNLLLERKKIEKEVINSVFST